MTIEYALSNVDWVQTGVKYVLGLSGIFVYAVWKVRSHLSNFDFGKLIKENKAFWIWATVMITMVLIILTISPETQTAIKSMTGLDVGDEPAAFLLLGWSLSALSNEVSKKSLNKKEGANNL